MMDEADISRASRATLHVSRFIQGGHWRAVPSVFASNASFGENGARCTLHCAGERVRS
jgi:hypothetical protein